MALVPEIAVLLLTALVSGAVGHRWAGHRAAPMIADLGIRVEVAERGLYNQGQAIRELTEALRGLVAELEAQPGGGAHREAVVSARQLLMRH